MGVIKSPLGDLLVAMTARGIVLNHYLVDDSDLAATLEKTRLQLDLVDDRRTIKRSRRGDSPLPRRRRKSAAPEHRLESRREPVPAESFAQAPRRSSGRCGQLSSFGRCSRRSRKAPGRWATRCTTIRCPIYVPCHRVIASDGGLGGYGGGAERKLKLLRSEGFSLGDGAVRLPGSVVWGHKGTRIYCRADCRTAARVDRGGYFFSPMRKTPGRPACARAKFAGRNSDRMRPQRSRHARRVRETRGRDGIEVDLPFKSPYDWQSIIRFYQSHSIPGNRTGCGRFIRACVSARQHHRLCSQVLVVARKPR